MEWKYPYMGLLLLSLVFLILAFIVPLCYFSRLMKKQKESLLLQADEYSKRAHELREKLIDGGDEAA